MIDDKTLAEEGLTAIGDGIATGSALLARMKLERGSGRQVMVVFTDGEHNFGEDPLVTLAKANEAGTRVHMVGIDLTRSPRLVRRSCSCADAVRVRRALLRCHVRSAAAVRVLVNRFAGEGDARADAIHPQSTGVSLLRHPGRRPALPGIRRCAPCPTSSTSPDARFSRSPALQGCEVVHVEEAPEYCGASRHVDLAVSAARGCQLSFRELHLGVLFQNRRELRSLMTGAAARRFGFGVDPEEIGDSAAAQRFRGDRLEFED